MPYGPIACISIFERSQELRVNPPTPFGSGELWSWEFLQEVQWRTN